MMNNRLFIVLVGFGICAFCGCSGDHQAKNGKDTGVNSYHAKDTSKVDTSKVVSDDNSATGGAGNPKDTAKVKK